MKFGVNVIKLTRFNNQEFVVNAELVEFIDKTPETMLTLMTGKKIVVKETVEEVIARIVAYRQTVFPIVRKPDGCTDERSADR